ncbi:MAG: hypothetical protein ABW074_07910 [Sedimenticola sp.]
MEINTLDKAFKVARGFASECDLNEEMAETFAEDWFRGRRGAEVSTEKELRFFLSQKFSLQE